MATEAEIKAEILAKIREVSNDKVSGEIIADAAALELDEWASKEGLDGKSVLQKFYSQWKSGNKGNENKWNSITAYHLGMTNKAPKDKFFFTKRRAFARPSPPDIDSDFEYERRHEIIDYLVAKYGRYNVGNIGTYGALKMRSAVTRIVKALDIANAWRDNDKAAQAEYTTLNVEKVREILDSLPPQRGALLKVTDDDGEHVIKNCEDAAKYCRDFRFYMEKYPDILKHAKQIEGLLSIFGCLAADTPVLTQKGWARIDQLDRSCEIAYLDSNGEQKFSDNYISVKTGVKPCYRMRLENGDFIDVTDEHLIFTDTGCVEFRKIRENPEKYKVLTLLKNAS